MVAPSSLVLLLDCGMPLACVTMERCGLPDSECASTGGVKPGRILYSTWKLRPCELINGRSTDLSGADRLLMSARSVCSATAPALTVTLSDTCDTAELDVQAQHRVQADDDVFERTRAAKAGAEMVTL